VGVGSAGADRERRRSQIQCRAVGTGSRSFPCSVDGRSLLCGKVSLLRNVIFALMLFAARYKFGM